MWQSLHKNGQNTVLKMELPLRVVTPCEVHVGIHFFTIRNKSALEIHREVCSCHCRISCIDIQFLYTKHTSSWILIADLFWVEEKWVAVHTSQGRTTRNGSTIFNTACCTFLWSDCHIIFTVFPETQNLYFPAILHWSVHKTPRKKTGKLTFEKTVVRLHRVILRIIQKSGYYTQ